VFDKEEVSCLSLPYNAAVKEKEASKMGSLSMWFIGAQVWLYACVCIERADMHKMQNPRAKTL
jgi:hypothetical protein